MLSPVHHGEQSVHTLKELARSYLTLTQDLTRVMNRIKGLYRSWGIRCAGGAVYTAAPRRLAGQIARAWYPPTSRSALPTTGPPETLTPASAEELLAESHNHPASKLPCEVPTLGPIRVALVIALMQTPHRFRTKRQLWAYRRPSVGDPRHWRIPVRCWGAATIQEGCHSLGPQRKPQS
jgi:hypothetical protein